jgi:hypothetical protein
MTRPATPMEIADAVLAGPHQEHDDWLCRGCGEVCHKPDDLVETPFCNQCAHDKLEQLALAYVELARNYQAVKAAQPSVISSPPRAPWQPPRPGGFGRRRK